MGLADVPRLVYTPDVQAGGRSPRQLEPASPFVEILLHAATPWCSPDLYTFQTTPSVEPYIESDPVSGSGGFTQQTRGLSVNSARVRLDNLRGVLGDPLLVASMVEHRKVGIEGLAACSPALLPFL